MIYSSVELMQKYNRYADPKGKIRRLVQNGTLIRIKKGLYEDDPYTEPASLAVWILAPSYLSFDYALSYHGLIPESSRNYTSATYGLHKQKTFTNSFGSYFYRDVPADVFYKGVSLDNGFGSPTPIASCEKALCDKLYALSPMKNQKELEELLFDDMRIDECAFSSLDHADLMELAPMYHSKNLDLLSRFLLRRI